LHAAREREREDKLFRKKAFVFLVFFLFILFSFLFTAALVSSEQAKATFGACSAGRG